MWWDSVQFISVAQSCPTLCDPVNRSTPCLPVHHQLSEFTQTHVHRVGDAIQPSHPLSSPSPPAPDPSQHQGLFQWVNSSHEVAKVLEFQLQHQSFQWTPRTYLPQDGLVGSPCSPRDCQESSPGLEKTITHSLRLDSRNGILDVKLFLPGSSNSFKNILKINLFGCLGCKLWQADSLVAEFRLSCSEACGILVTSPGIKPAFSALQSVFLTTGPPVRSLNHQIPSHLET